MARIMVVDDERDVVTLIKFLLEKEGHAITEAFNGAEALELLGLDPVKPDVQRPELVVLDIMMPIVDGYTVCQRMQQDPRCRRIPIVILTARGQMKELFSGTPNIADYLEKPFDPKMLRERIAAILAKDR